MTSRPGATRTLASAKAPSEAFDKWYGGINAVKPGLARESFYYSSSSQALRSRSSRPPSASLCENPGLNGSPDNEYSVTLMALTPEKPGDNRSEEHTSEL